MVGMGCPASLGGSNSSPGFFGTSKMDSRLCFGASGFVTTVVQRMWALLAQVHQVFSPFSRYSLPFFVARHLMPALSEPASGSVNAAAQRISPVQIPGSHFFFCSSVPFDWMSDAV